MSDHKPPRRQPHPHAQIYLCYVYVNEAQHLQWSEDLLFELPQNYIFMKKSLVDLAPEHLEALWLTRINLNIGMD